MTNTVDIMKMLPWQPSDAVFVHAITFPCGKVIYVVWKTLAIQTKM